MKTVHIDVAIIGAGQRRSYPHIAPLRQQAPARF